MDRMALTDGCEYGSSSSLLLLLELRADAAAERVF